MGLYFLLRREKGGGGRPPDSRELAPGSLILVYHIPVPRGNVNVQLVCGRSFFLRSHPWLSHPFRLISAPFGGQIGQTLHNDRIM